MMDAEYHERLIQAFMADMKNPDTIKVIEAAITAGKLRSATVDAFREARRRLAMISLGIEP